MTNNNGKESLMTYIFELRHYRKRALDLNRKVRKLSREERYHSRVKLLRLIPGVGLITSMILLTELIDINRFESTDKLVSYAGLVPDLKASEERSKDRGITIRRNNYLRATLIESSWIAVRKDPALTMYYMVF